MITWPSLAASINCGLLIADAGSPHAPESCGAESPEGHSGAGEDSDQPSKPDSPANRELSIAEQASGTEQPHSEEGGSPNREQADAQVLIQEPPETVTAAGGSSDSEHGSEAPASGTDTSASEPDSSLRETQSEAHGGAEDVPATPASSEFKWDPPAVPAVMSIGQRRSALGSRSSSLGSCAGMYRAIDRHLEEEEERAASVSGQDPPTRAPSDASGAELFTELARLRSEKLRQLGRGSETGSEASDGSDAVAELVQDIARVQLQRS